MYGGSEQVFVKKNTYAGVVREKQNYLMYEDVDETEKFKKKRPVLKAKKPEPIFDPLDNYRYYEDLTLRDRRRRSKVKHERTGKPVGRETPFLRDSFKKHVVNYTPTKTTLRSYSNERSERRPKPKKYDPNQITFSPTLKHQTYICYPSKKRGSGICPTCGGPWDQDRKETPENYGVLRQLHSSPKRNQFRPKANNNKPRAKKPDTFQSYQFDDNCNDEYDDNYRYKEVKKIKKPKRNDSKTHHKRRKERSSSFGKGYRNQPRFDDGFSSQTSSSFYCPIHGYQ